MTDRGLCGDNLSITNDSNTVNKLFKRLRSHKTPGEDCLIPLACRKLMKSLQAIMKKDVGNSHEVSAVIYPGAPGTYIDSSFRIY